MLDLAKIVVSAQDDTRTGIDSARGNVQNLGGAVESLSGKFVALGAASLSFGAFAAGMKHAIDMADEVNKLSQKLGLSVEKLQELKFAAGLADVETATLGKAIKGLSTNLVEAGNASSQAGQVLKALGVDISGGVNKAILQLADSFAMLPDSELKIAAAVKVFGKAGQEMIPFLNQGSAEIKRLGEVAQRLGLILDQDTTKAAEAFNDNLKIVKASGDRLWVTILNDLSPSLVRVSGAMRDAAIEGGLLKAVWVGLGGVAAEALGLNDSEVRKLQANLKRVQAEMAEFGTHIDAGRRKDLLAGVAMAGNMIEASFMKANFQLRLTQSTLDAMDGKFDDQVGRSARQGRGIKGLPAGFEQGLRNALNGSNGLAESEQKAFDAANLKLSEQIALWRERERLGRQLTEAEKELTEIEAGKYAKFTPLHQAYLKRRAEEWSIGQRLAAAAKADLDARLAEAGVLAKGLDSLNEKVAAARLENDTFGLTREQIELVTIARAEERLEQLRATEGADLQVKALELEIAKRRELVGEYARGDALKIELDQFRSFSGTVDGIAREFFTGLLSGNHDTWSRMKDQAKAQFFDWLYAQFGQPLVLRIAAQIFGLSPAAQAAAGLGGVANGLGGLGSLGGLAGLGLNAVNGLGNGAAALGLDGVANFLGGATGALQGPTLTGAALGGSAAGAGAMLASAMPYVAAAMLAYQLFSKPRGGPKGGGSFIGQYSSTGELQDSQFGERFFTPKGDDAALQSRVSDTSAAYFKLLKALGGSVGGAVTFGLGYDTDPKGTASNRISSSVLVNGQQVFGSKDRDIGRDAAALGPELQLEASRSLLAALKASDLPKAVAGFLNSIETATASQETIDSALKAASAIQQIMDIVGKNPLDEFARQAEEAQDVLGSALERNRAPLDAAIGAFDGTAASIEALTGATSQYYLANVQLIAQIRQIKASVDEMFGNTARSIRLQTMDNQGKYNFYQNEAESLYQQLLGSKDPAEIQRLAQKINEDINAAFGLLSPEDQARMAPEFLERINKVNEAAQAHLGELEARAVTATDEALAKVSALMEKYFGEGQDSADKFGEAVDKFDKALARPVPIAVTMHGDGGYEVQPGNR